MGNRIDIKLLEEEEMRRRMKKVMTNSRSNSRGSSN
jgi:hypothetical protein